MPRVPTAQPAGAGPLPFSVGQRSLGAARAPLASAAEQFKGLADQVARVRAVEQAQARRVAFNEARAGLIQAIDETARVVEQQPNIVAMESTFASEVEKRTQKIRGTLQGDPELEAAWDAMTPELVAQSTIGIRKVQRERMADHESAQLFRSQQATLSAMDRAQTIEESDALASTYISQVIENPYLDEVAKERAILGFQQQGSERRADRLAFENPRAFSAIASDPDRWAREFPGLEGKRIDFLARAMSLEVSRENRAAALDARREREIGRQIRRDAADAINNGNLDWVPSPETMALAPVDAFHAQRMVDEAAGRAQRGDDRAFRENFNADIINDAFQDADVVIRENMERLERGDPGAPSAGAISAAQSRLETARALRAEDRRLAKGLEARNLLNPFMLRMVGTTSEQQDVLDRGHAEYSQFLSENRTVPLDEKLAKRREIKSGMLEEMGLAIPSSALNQSEESVNLRLEEIRSELRAGVDPETAIRLRDEAADLMQGLDILKRGATDTSVRSRGLPANKRRTPNVATGVTP